MFQFDFAKAAAEKDRVGRNLGGNVRALGELGEQLVHYIVGGDRSENRFNDQCDIVDRLGRQVEVKTQNRFRRYHKEVDADLDVFSVKWAQEGEKHRTNFEKCLSVKRLIFVEYRPILHVPPWDKPYDTLYHDWIHVWECMDRTTLAGRYRAAQGWMYSWPIQEMWHLWEEHDTDAANEFRKYSSAGNSID